MTMNAIAELEVTNVSRRAFLRGHAAGTFVLAVRISPPAFAQDKKYGGEAMSGVTETRTQTAHAACDTISSHCAVSARRPGGCSRKKQQPGGAFPSRKFGRTITRWCTGPAAGGSALEFLPVVRRRGPFRCARRLSSKPRASFATSVAKTSP